VPRFAIILGLLATVLLGACGERRNPAPAPPASSAAKEPRYGVLSPGLAVILRDLGVAGRAVGRSDWNMVLPASLPVCGNQAGIDYEALAGTRPTDIFLQWRHDAIPARLVEMAKARGWALHNFEPLTLDDIRETTRSLGTITGADASELVARMDQAWKPRPDLERAGRVLLLESVNPPAALGPGSWHHQLLERIGGTPAVTSGGPYIVMDAEAVLKLAPDAIVIISPRDPGATHEALSGEVLKARLGGLARLDIPAVRNARVALIDDPLALTPSTAMIGLADELAAILSGWAGAEATR
jgi:ABC-type Fe3+-hydroxamate transport system substrate-binding protein